MAFRLALAALLLFVAAPLAAQSPAPAFDPAGKYTFTTPVGGTPFDFEMTVVKKDDGSFGGVVTNPNTGEIPITSLNCTARTCTGTIASPQGEAKIQFTVAEDLTMEGEWAMAGDGAKLTGKKIS